MAATRILTGAALAAALLGAAGNAAAVPVSAAPTAEPAHVRGTIVSVHGDVLDLRLRTGKVENVDIAAARAKHHTGVLPVGGAVVVYGTRGADGTFHATSVGHTNPDATAWPADD